MEKEEFIDLIKAKGFEYAISVNMREENQNWLCPCCKSSVIITGQREYETLSEHVSDPNRLTYPERDAYQCSDEKCITRIHDVFWDYHGDRYGSIKRDGSSIFDNDLFINKNDSPFGSYSRKTNVEINRVGLEDNRYYHPAFCLWFLQPYIEFKYTADTDGNVLSKKSQLKFLKRNERDEFTLHFSPAWGTWRFLNDRLKRHINQFKETNDSDHLKKAFKNSFNRDWPYRWFEIYSKIRYYRQYLIHKS